ncbi:MAG TPA: DUF2723 domain-containing protein [Polyangiales bacterium]|nr:DUF2723 domain-containing protein [Polyangiales bacterium]
MTDRILGLPVQSRRATAAATAALFAYYVATMCRSFSMYDSPELALVAEQLGLGHPFGQPLHTLLGALAVRLPGLDPLIALNGLSALAGALTVIPATSLAQTLVRPDPRCPPGDLRFISPAVALAGVHTALWEPSTRIEVYSLAVFFVLWAAARCSNALLDQDQRSRLYFSVGLAFGLAASANVVCAFGGAIAITPRLLIAVFRKEIPRRALALLIGGGLLGLATYAYVFLVAGREDVVVWGAPTDAAAIKHYFTAADFSAKGVTSWAEWWDHMKQLFFWSLQNGLFALLLTGFAGYAIYARRRGLGRFFFNATLLFFAAFIARNGVFATDVLDYNGYLAIPAWIAASGVGLLVAYLGARKPQFAVASLAAVLLLVLTAPPGPAHRTRHRDKFTADIAREALAAAPRDAIVIVRDDHWIGPMWYLQEQTGLRPDITLLAYGLSASGWYWDHLYRRHPDLALITLRGPGGRDARVLRFLRANPGHPVQIESVALADQLGLPTCPSDWMLDVRTGCAPDSHERSLGGYARAALAELGLGSPGTDGLIAMITLDRGHDLYSQGFPRAAIATLLSGVPRTDGIEEPNLDSVPERIPRLIRPVPSYDPPVALGHPAQNLHYASIIAHETGATGLGIYFAGLSAAMGPVQPKFASRPAAPANL